LSNQGAELVEAPSISSLSKRPVFTAAEEFGANLNRIYTLVQAAIN
jgi:hypothetical protein